jgi:hypothetical protein
VLAAIERDRYIVTLSGILGDHPPIDPAEFEAFATTLVFPDITEALQGAQPLDDPVAIRFPASVRRRYERLRRFRCSCWSPATPCARSTPSTGKV